MSSEKIINEIGDIIPDNILVYICPSCGKAIPKVVANPFRFCKCNSCGWAGGYIDIKILNLKAYILGVIKKHEEQ